MVGQVEDKDPKGLPYIKHLLSMLLLIREDTQPFLSRCVSLPFSSKQTVSLCALPHVCCAMSLIINSVLGFTVFASMIHAFFH